MSEKAPNPEFPAVFVEYARNKMKTDRDMVEYLSRFGNKTERGVASLILSAAAAGEGDKIGK